ncbi:hypothetical protein [Okeania sp. SIO2C2]|nr:hypothetical protein [Okeania sp. SIO2C2]
MSGRTVINKRRRSQVGEPSDWRRTGVRSQEGRKEKRRRKFFYH